MRFIEFSIFVSSILASLERPVTEATLNEAIRSLAEELKDEVLRVITTSEAQYLTILQQEIKRSQLAESLNISRKFEEIQTMIKGLSNNGNVNNPNGNVNNPNGNVNNPNGNVNNTTNIATNPEESMSYIIPIFLKLMKCNNCFSCKRDEVCFYYVFMYVLPLILNKNGQLKESPTNNAIFQTLMANYGNQQPNNNLPFNSQPNLPFNQPFNQHNVPFPNPFNNSNQQVGQPNNNLLQSLFNFMFNDSIGTPQYQSQYQSPSYGPVPSRVAPPPAYGPQPQVAQPTYGPSSCDPPSRMAFTRGAPLKTNTKPGDVSYGPCPPSFRRRTPEYVDTQECINGCELRN